MRERERDREREREREREINDLFLSDSMNYEVLISQKLRLNIYCYYLLCVNFFIFQ